MRALIIGRAKGVWEEMERAKALGPFDTVIVCNQAVCDYPGPVDHWVSFHANLFDHWVKIRRHRGYPDPTTWWTAIYQGNRLYGNLQMPNLRRVACNGGSTGMVAVMVALETKQQRAVLCGIPMDNEAGHYDLVDPWKEAQKYRPAWLEALPRIKDKVKSMSGWTRDLLGEPTADWLNQIP